jgi:hypothetical protein
MRIERNFRKLRLRQRMHWKVTNFGSVSCGVEALFDGIPDLPPNKMLHQHELVLPQSAGLLQLEVMFIRNRRIPVSKGCSIA